MKPKTQRRVRLLGFFEQSEVAHEFQDAVPAILIFFSFIRSHSKIGRVLDGLVLLFRQLIDLFFDAMDGFGRLGMCALALHWGFDTQIVPSG